MHSQIWIIMHWRKIHCYNMPQGWRIEHSHLCRFNCHYETFRKKNALWTSINGGDVSFKVKWLTYTHLCLGCFISIAMWSHSKCLSNLIMRYYAFIVYQRTDDWGYGPFFTHPTHSLPVLCDKVQSMYIHHSDIITCYSASHDNWCTGALLNRLITAQWEGMGDVGSARYEPALLPPCPTIRVLSYSNLSKIHPLHF